MPRKKVDGPTEEVLQIPGIFWRHGPNTVRQVNSIMNRNGPTGYATTLKLMQIMYEKGLLKCEAAVRTHVYADDMH